MDVHVGMTSDPPHLPGTAHFCEHMLFLGTGKAGRVAWMIVAGRYGWFDRLAGRSIVLPPFVAVGARQRVLRAI